MHFPRSSASHHPDNLPAGGASNDRVIDQNDALTFELMPHRVQLQLDPEVSNRLRGLDEGSPDVVIPYQSLTIRNTGLGSVTERRRHARIRDRHNDVCFYRM